MKKIELEQFVARKKRMTSKEFTKITQHIWRERHNEDSNISRSNLETNIQLQKRGDRYTKSCGIVFVSKKDHRPNTTKMDRKN